MLHQHAKIGEHVKIWHQGLSNIGKCTIGDYSIIHSHVWIGDDVVIGNGVKIQAFSFIPTGVTIEDRVFIGPRVTFTNDKHPPSQGKGWTQTKVCTNAVIGAGAIILPGVTIGEGAVVGAGSVVTKDVPMLSTVYGNPAKVKHEVVCAGCSEFFQHCKCKPTHFEKRPNEEVIDLDTGKPVFVDE